MYSSVQHINAGHDCAGGGQGQMYSAFTARYKYMRTT